MPSAMRTADRRLPSGRSRALAASIVIGVLAIGCGGGQPSASPTIAAAVQTPAPTPIAHLAAPVQADVIYRAMVRAGLKIAPNNASTGGPGHEPVKRINATYAGWPLSISEYSSVQSLLDATKWKTGAAPESGEAPISYLGLNILIEWGPTTGAGQRKPDDKQLAAAEALHAALDPLVSPVAARTIVPIPGVSATPEPVATPVATAGPTPKPPKATPKPTRKP